MRPKDQGQPAEGGWPGPQGRGDSVGMAAHRVARRGAARAALCSGSKARIQGLPKSLADCGSETARAEGPFTYSRRTHPPVHGSAKCDTHPKGRDTAGGSVHEWRGPERLARDSPNQHGLFSFSRARVTHHTTRTQSHGPRTVSHHAPRCQEHDHDARQPRG